MTSTSSSPLHIFFKGLSLKLFFVDPDLLFATAAYAHSYAFKVKPEETRRRDMAFLSGVASHAGKGSGPSISAQSSLSWRQAL